VYLDYLLALQHNAGW